MRWLLIALLVSVGGLLLAAAGVVRHIALHRRRQQQASIESDGAVAGVHKESGAESEH
jgi:hypothetical protein